MVETGFEPDSTIAAGVGVIGVLEVVAAVPTIVAADSGSRVEIVALAAAQVVGAVAAVPRVVGAGIVLVPIAVGTAAGIPAALDIPALVPGSRAVSGAVPRIVAVALAAASMSSVVMAALLRRLGMLPGLHGLCDRCGCVAICRGLPGAQTVR